MIQRLEAIDQSTGLRHSLEAAADELERLARAHPTWRVWIYDGDRLVAFRPENREAVARARQTA